MIQYKAVRTLKNPIEQLFEIVKDVEKYPEFVPWCLDAQILSHFEDGMNVRLKVGSSFLSDSYVSKVLFFPPFRIESTCDSGSLKSLKNVWLFKQVEEGTQATLTCSFELESFLLNTLMTGIVQDIGSKMIAAFEQRAKLLCNKE